jgi:uncharacterized protein
MKYKQDACAQMFLLLLLLGTVSAPSLWAQTNAGSLITSAQPQSANNCAVTRPREYRSCSGEVRKPLPIALLEAVAIGDLAQLKKLIRQKVNVNFQAENGSTALLLAAGHQDLEMVRLLLRAGADPNLGTYGDEMPLMVAASGRCVKIVQALLQSGAAVDDYSKSSATALFNAASANNVAIIKLLVAAGADIAPDVKPEGERSPFVAAVRNKNLEIVRFLLSQDKAGRMKVSYGAALWYAVSNSDIGMVKYFLEQKVGVVSGSALGEAAMRGNPEVIKLLLQAGADPNISGEQTSPPLNWACTYGHTETVGLLIAAKADVNAKWGWTALIEAARNNHLEVMRLLLEAGARINEPANDGRTALMYASGAGKVEAVRFLLEQGADMNVKKDDGTALSVAKLLKHTEIVSLLVNAGAVQ